jgi:hypothetical protein
MKQILLAILTALLVIGFVALLCWIEKWIEDWELRRLLKSNVKKWHKRMSITREQIERLKKVDKDLERIARS